MDRKIKIWIGTTKLDENSYMKLFELDYETESFEDKNYKICDFCKHIGEFWYDDDFIGIIPIAKGLVELDKLISETPLNLFNKDKLKKDCLNMEIEQGNIILFYSGETRKIKIGEKFNDLIYVGEYSC